MVLHCSHLLCAVTFTPLVIPSGEYKPMLFGIPYTLWTGFIITVALVVVTYIGTRVHPGMKDEEGRDDNMDMDSRGIICLHAGCRIPAFLQERARSAEDFMLGRFQCWDDPGRSHLRRSLIQHIYLPGNARFFQGQWDRRLDLPGIIRWGHGIS